MPDSLPQTAALPATFGERAPAVPRVRAYGLLALATIASGFGPVDQVTWNLEVLVLGLVYAGLFGVSRQNRETRMSAPFLWTMLVYGFVMLIGAHWTYGHAPPGEWLREALGMTRNPWDRVGHLFQGAVPALFVLGCTRLRSRRALAFAAGVGTSLLFEALEAGAAALMQDGAKFVQAGGPHDSLFDVGFATLGALLALLWNEWAESNERASRSLRKQRPGGA